MSEKLVSVILCNYNYSEFIAHAIESVLNQTYSMFELIIVDDGSTDNSQEIIRNYTDNRIKTIFQENRGQAGAFNAGFKIAKGDFIAFLDSDDFWTLDKLEKSINYFYEYDVALVQHNLFIVNKNNEHTNELRPNIEVGIVDGIDFYKKNNHSNIYANTSGLIFRKSILDRIFPIQEEQWRICADVAFTRPMVVYGLIYNCKEVLGYYRVHDSNSWWGSKEQSKLIENQKKYFAYTNEWFENNGHEIRLNYKKSPYYKKRLSLAQYLKSKIKNIYFKLIKNGE